MRIRTLLLALCLIACVAAGVWVIAPSYMGMEILDKQDEESHKGKWSSDKVSEREHISHGVNKSTKIPQIDTIAYLEAIYQEYPELAIDLKPQGEDLTQLMEEIFPENKYEMLSEESEQFQAMLLGKSGWNQDFIDDYLARYDKPLQALLNIDPDIIYVPPFEFSSSTSLRKCQALLSSYYAYDLVITNTPNRAKEIGHIEQKITSHLLGGNLMNCSVGIANSLSNSNLRYELCMANPNLLPSIIGVDEAPVVPNLGDELDFKQIIRSEYAASLRMTHQFAEYDDNGAIVLDCGEEEPTIPIEIMERLATLSYLSQLHTLEEFHGKKPIDFSTMENALQQKVQNFNLGNLSTNKNINDLYSIDLRHYYEASLKANTQVIALQTALRIASELHQHGDIQTTDLPCNLITGEPFAYDPETKLLHTGLEGDKATIPVPVSD